MTECVREAVHFWLKGKGKGDGLFFTHEETLEAIWEDLVAGKGKGKGEQE